MDEAGWSTLTAGSPVSAGSAFQHRKKLKLSAITQDPIRVVSEIAQLHQLILADGLIAPSSLQA